MEAEYPPGYLKCIEQMVELIPAWCRAQVSRPDLQFHDWGDTMFSGVLSPETYRFLAASPDAVRLLDYLAQETKGEGTLIQARHALKHLGAFEKPVEVKTSAALQSLTHFAKATGTTVDLPPSPCGHCGRLNEKSSGDPGHLPEPGCLMVCIGCGGLNILDDEMKLARFSDEEIESAIQ